MAVDRTPVLKRCRQLGIEPVTMGYNKKSNRAEHQRRRRQESEYGQQLREKQTDEEAKAAERAAKDAEIMAELEALRHEKLVGTYVTSYMAMGYDEKLAKATAEAMANGDTETVFKNQKIRLENREKALRAELLMQTPDPAPGNPTDVMTKEKLRAMSPQERYEFSVKNPEEYKTIYGGN